VVGGWFARPRRGSISRSSPTLSRRMGFFKSGRPTQLYMRSDAHGERAQKVYALDYCAASFVTEGEHPHPCHCALLPTSAAPLPARI
jgi:hypothetical protein